MTGIFFLFVFGLWAVIAVVLGSKIPKWLGLTRYRKIFSVVLASLIFSAPVADEIIAYPQMMALCRQDRFFEMVSGVDEKTAYGKTVYSEERNAMETIFPSTVKVMRWSTVYVDATTKEALFKRSGARPLRGMLGVPNGSSGGQMTVLLSACNPTGESFDSKGVPSRFSHLKLTKIPKP